MANPFYGSPLGMVASYQMSPFAGSYTGLGGGLGQYSGQPGWVTGLNDAYAQMALINSQNAQASYAPQAQLDATRDTNRSNELIEGRRIDQRESTLNSVIPALIQALGGIGGQGGGGFRTDYGAGATFGSGAQPVNSRMIRQRPQQQPQWHGG